VAAMGGHDQMTAFEDMARAALGLAGIPPTDSDLAVLGAVAQALEPGMRALDRADLEELPPESALDPSRAPMPDVADGDRS